MFWRDIANFTVKDIEFVLVCASMNEGKRDNTIIVFIAVVGWLRFRRHEWYVVIQRNKARRNYMIMNRDPGYCCKRNRVVVFQNQRELIVRSFRLISNR